MIKIFSADRLVGVVRTATPELAERAAWALAEAGVRLVEITLTVPDAMVVHLNLKTGFIFDAFPGWADTMALPPDEKKRALGDPAVRRRLREGAASPEAGVLRAMANWERMRIVDTDNDT